MKILTELRRWTVALSLVALLSLTLSYQLRAQNDSDQDDPPTRVARLGYLQGSVSFQPAGESDWVDAVPNRPITIGDQLWVDNNSRAELELGSAVIDLGGNTGISFLNLDDNTIQIQLSSGAINIRVRRLGRDDDFEIDTPNQAFTIAEAGRYRVEASEDGTYSVVSIREGGGESTGNGSTYTIHAGQRVTFDGTDTLNAQMEDLGGPDDFDTWCYARYDHYEHSLSARYVSNDVVGYADLDDSGDWRPAMGYGDVWFPRVAAGWAPYHEGHWAWVDPWGWTWVDDEPWGYAPFHYGRWAFFSGRWGWVPGPREVAPVYAPALVVFVGGGGMAIGGNVAWFPLGPTEVYVPSYRVSRGYLTNINMSGTVVNQTVITNVYNTTIIRNETNIVNVKYANRSVAGAISAVPQQAFVSAQPVARVAVAVNVKQFASMPISARVAVAPTQNSVLGARFNTANRVKVPPAAIARRPIVAKSTPPPAPVAFAARQQALAAHPGQPIARQQMMQMEKARPANAQVARPQIRQAPAGRPATAVAKPAGRPANGPGNRPNNPAANEPAANQPAGNQRPGAGENRPGNQPNANRPENPPGNQPGNNQPANERPANNQPANNQPAPNRPANDRSNGPENRPAMTDRPQGNPPGNRPAPTQPQQTEPNRSQPNSPAPNRPDQNRPQQNPPQQNRPDTNRPDQTRPAPNNRPAEPPARNDRPNAQAPAQNKVPAAQPRTAPQQGQPAANQQRPNQQRPNQPSSDQQRPNQPPQRPETNRPPQPPQNGPGARPNQQNNKQPPANKNQNDDKKKDDKNKRDEKPPGN
ncbi:MAG: DUF6600 domain-containing protein [Terriglobales bacterium]